MQRKSDDSYSFGPGAWLRGSTASLSKFRRLSRSTRRQKHYQQADLGIVETLAECWHLTASTHCDTFFQVGIAAAVKPDVICEVWSAERCVASTVNAVARNAEHLVLGICRMFRYVVAAHIFDVILHLHDAIVTENSSPADHNGVRPLRMDCSICVGVPPHCQSVSMRLGNVSACPAAS